MIARSRLSQSATPHAMLRTASLLLACTLAVLPSFATPARAADAPFAVSMASNVVVNSAAQIWSYASEGFGIFAKAGLSVKNVFNNGGAVSIGQVAAGQVDFGESSIENVANAILAGEPIHPIATLITSSVWVLGVLDSSPIKTLAQLSGKTLGVPAYTGGGYPFAQEVVAENNLQQVTYAVAGNGGPAAQAVSSGQVDALVTSDQQWVTIQQLGVRVRFLPQPKVARLPSDVIFTSEKYYQAHKDVCIKMAAAIFAGIAKAQAQPDVAVGYFERLYPEIARSVPTAESQALIRARLQHVIRIPAQKGQWGYEPPAEYATNQELGLQYNTIKAPGIDLKKILNNELVPAINAEVNRLLKS